MKSSNLWILTEERPKREVLFNIIKKFADDNKISFFVEQNLFIVPILNINGDFSFGYKILGIHSAVIKNVFLFVVSGNSSFTDFLIFYQIHKEIYRFMLSRKQKLATMRVEIRAFFKGLLNLFLLTYITKKLKK